MHHKLPETISISSH